MSPETLIDDGWAYHDTESERLAGELEAAIALVDDGVLDRFVNLSNHTLGEHLGDWPRARRLAERLLAHRSPTAETARAWTRLGVARIMAGDAAAGGAIELAAFAAAADPLAAMIEARFLLVAALVGSKRCAQAAELYDAALALAEQLGEAAPARAIAVASNNLATELLETEARTSDEDGLMARAADAAQHYWGRCGTWVNEERALYLKALVASALGRGEDALAHADAALAIIAANGDEPVDATFLRLAKSKALSLAGDPEASAAELAAADAGAAAWDDAGLKAWYAEERARAIQ